MLVILPYSPSVSPLSHICSRAHSPRITLCYSLDRDDKKIRLGLPSKGRLANDTHDLLKECLLTINQVNPRQYLAEIRELPNLEVWFQRPTGIVRKLLSGDLDLGIVGLDTVREYGQGSEDLVIVHDDLGYGRCHLSLAIPRYGIFENINAFKDLVEMPQWTFEKPITVATGFTYLTHKFFEENGFENGRFVISIADGAVEAEPRMRIADIVVDLVGSGTTLKENNLKEIEGGKILQSQAVLVGSRKSLLKRYVLEPTREILERLEARLKASKQLVVTANMRGNSIDEVADLVLGKPLLTGLQGPTISPVKSNVMEPTNFFAIVICVDKDMLYKAVQQLREIGGSGVLVTPLTYIFDEEPDRWLKLLTKLGIDSF